MSVIPWQEIGCCKSRACSYRVREAECQIRWNLGDAELRELDHNGGAEHCISENVIGGIDNWRGLVARGCWKSEGVGSQRVLEVRGCWKSEGVGSQRVVNELEVERMDAWRDDCFAQGRSMQYSGHVES